MSAEILFEEEQRFNRKIIGGILIVINLLLFASCIILLFFSNENNRNVLFVFLPALIILILVSYLISKSRLITQVHEDGIYVRFYPFHTSFRKYNWADIRELYLRRYNPPREYGGWGIRWGPSGTAFNVSGDIGIQLVLKNNKRILIGTNVPDDITGLLGRLNKLDRPFVQS
jgi:hypothetical protein